MLSSTRSILIFLRFGREVEEAEWELAKSTENWERETTKHGTEFSIDESP